MEKCAVSINSWSGVLEIGTGGVIASWARTTLLSTKGEGWDSKTTSLSVAMSLVGVTGSGAPIEIPDKSSSEKANATCLRQSSKPVPYLSAQESMNDCGVLNF